MRRLLILALAVLAACAREAPPPADPLAEWTGDYRAALQVPGGELPFGLSITEENGRLVAWVINGAERLRVDEATVTNGELLLRMPGYENRITAKLEGGQLRGELFMVKSRARHQQIPFTAQRGAPVRFFPAPADPGGSVDGRWATTFSDEDGVSYIAVGEFQQRGSDVTGTFLTPTGDYRFLSGELREGKLYLSTFNGGHVFLFHGTLSSDGTSLQGDYWSGLRSHETFAAHRDEKASLGNTTQVTAVRSAKDPFAFTFPDLDGKPVSLSDPQYKGKVVIVSLGGSWCPNCQDEATFLMDMQRKYGAQGLEVVGLMFEQLTDPAEMRQAITRYRDRWSITFPLLVAATLPMEDSKKVLPQLNDIHGYPTTIFVDRKGLVRYIHTGFSGPATGTHYTELIADLEKRVQAMLAEKA